MWLGIAFVFLAIFATILQGWLWSFPMAPNPGGADPHGKTTAPAFWRFTHRIMGFAFVVIYIILMWEMVPRLWEYQFELPARTIIHACMGIVIGVLLCTKISILRWFRHFGGALPTIGLSILTCTIILATLSIPFAVRAHDFGAAAEPANMERVERVLSGVDFGEELNIKALVTKETFEAGLNILTSKCAVCHDMRTILIKPRTGKGWYSVVDRMTKKPNLGSPITRSDVLQVTAYLVAITPNIQNSYKQKKDTQRAQKKRTEELKEEMMTAKAPAEDAPPFDMAKAKLLYEEKCSECHELTDVDEHGNDTREGWIKIVTNMVEEQEAELSKADAKTIIEYLTQSKGK
jgi:cytochrome c5